MSAADLPPFPDNVQTHPLFVVDYELIRTGDECEIDTLWKAATELGFWYLKNHGVEHEVEEMFDMGDETMSLPLAEKMQFDQGNDGRSFGYKASGTSATDDRGTPDATEYLNVAADDAFSYPVPTHRTYPRTVAARMPGTIAPFIRKARAICSTLLSVFNERLALPEGALGQRHAEKAQSGSEARYVRSLPILNGMRETHAPVLGAHTDFGSLSFLSNRLGGLQVLVPGTESWQYIKPLPGHAICNIGDALTIFSGGILRSNMHRVVPPPPPQSSHTRTSLVFFSRPNNDVPLHALAAESHLIADAVSRATPADRSRYNPGVTSAEWLTRRVRNRRLKHFTGPESWRASRGTEHTPQAA